MTGQQTMTAGAPGQELTAPGPGRDVAAGPGSDLPEGVLTRVTPAMATAIGTVAAVAMAEAAWNLGRACFTILDLPLPLAIGFPLLFESAAASFALQDLKDRRAGHASRAMRWATYATLAVSAAVNGIVGWIAYGATGLVEILPPLVLAAVIHLHGDRATRAHHSQAVLRPSWRQARLETARRDAVLDVLPLLAGDDTDGRATVDLLRRWMESGTLASGEALLAAGWHQRAERDMPASRLRRLETVAAAVWGPAGPPAPPAPAAGPVTRPAMHPVTARPSDRAATGTAGSSSESPGGSTSQSTTGRSPRSTAPAGGSTAGSTGGLPAGSSDGSKGGPAPADGRSIQELRARSIEDLQRELTGLIEAGQLPAAPSAKSIRERLQVSPDRSRTLRDWAETTSPEARQDVHDVQDVQDVLDFRDAGDVRDAGVPASAPPQLRVLPGTPASQPDQLDEHEGQGEDEDNGDQAQEVAR